MSSIFQQIVLLDHEGNRAIKETGLYATDDTDDNNVDTDANVKKVKTSKTKNATADGTQVKK
jgi:hypothetical protein